MKYGLLGEREFSFLWEEILRKNPWGRVVVSTSVLQETMKLLSRVATPVYIPTSNVGALLILKQMNHG